VTGCRGGSGFTLVELLVSMALTSVVMACVFLLVSPAREAFTVQPEAADVQQRVRVTVGALMEDLLMAGSGRSADDGCLEPMGAPVLPYRAGDVASDARAGIYFRPGVVSLAYAETAPDGTAPEVVRRTYYLKPIPPDSSQLMQYDGRETDHPVLDDVVTLAFEFFASPVAASPPAPVDPVPLDPATLIDGPWCPDASDPERFDADLLRIRRVGVRLRVQAPRPFRGRAGELFMHEGDARPSGSVPDQEIRFDVAPRNLNRDR
jgi:prepilin-type N-terminal cleavage/methylation domain-containing protein